MYNALSLELVLFPKVDILSCHFNHVAPNSGPRTQTTVQHQRHCKPAGSPARWLSGRQSKLAGYRLSGRLLAHAELMEPTIESIDTTYNAICKSADLKRGIRLSTTWLPYSFEEPSTRVGVFAGFIFNDTGMLEVRRPSVRQEK